MKRIELTGDHRIKLIEMCAALFPEYKSIEIHGSNVYFDVTEHINWFEFCYGELLSKIFNSGRHPDEYYKEDPAFDDTNGRFEFGQRFTWSNNFHPVDYLYQEFKKLK